MAAEIILGPIVEVALSKVISIAEKQINLVAGCKEELRRFCATLKMVKGLLVHAEQKQASRDPGVKAWLEELQRIAYEADVLLDEIAYDSLQHEVARKHVRKQVSSFFTQFNPLLVRRRAAVKISGLNDALTEVNRQASALGIKKILAEIKEDELRMSTPQTDSSLDESLVVGRDSDVQGLIRLLVKPINDQSLDVVSIEGVGGLGKTTIAKVVYNNGQIHKHFSKMFWICVSENFDVSSILIEMMASLGISSSEIDATKQNLVFEKVKEKLCEKNYLLVLDDVWSVDERKWEDLKNCLVGITKKVGSSRVLVTTRIPKVASMMGSLNESIRLLNAEDCWCIIKQKAFHTSCVPPELEEIGRVIATKCRGIPLVAKVVGGALRDRRNKDHWLSIANDFDACVPLVDDDRILRVLKLSYDRLPKPALKRCFAFCSFFPKDYVMEREMLIQLWMAEGFLQPHDSSKEMEAVGNDYFLDLVSYSFFQDIKRDRFGRIVSCKVHDLMHNLAKSISMSETLVLEGSVSIHETRHLNIICSPSVWPRRTVEVIQGLHTLFSKVNVFGVVPVNFDRLLVLSFCNAFKISELPCSLGKLKRLRYFDVSGTSIEEIPKFVFKLYHLQTFKFENCRRLIRRPLGGVRNLINLKHLYYNQGMPVGIGSLTGLQTLPYFSVRNEKGCGVEELEHLNQLKGDLKIVNLSLVKTKAQAIKAKLCEKPGIVRLKLKYSSCYTDQDKLEEDVLESLRPHSNLKGFTLMNYGGQNCPSWMSGGSGHLNLESSIPSGLLSNLVHMKIFQCYNLEKIPALSLSNEANLEIDNCRRLKDIVVLSVKNLIVKRCPKLANIDFDPHATMTSLQKVTIIDCDETESIQMNGELSSLEIFVLQNCWELNCLGGSGLFTSICLKELRIDHCPNLISMPSIDGLSSLESIHIRYCQQLKGIWEVESLSSFTHLGELDIYKCDALMSIRSLDGLSSLESVCIENCVKLKSIGGESLSAASTRLRELRIWQCPALASVPNLQGLTSLERFSIGYCGLSEFPDGMSSLLNVSRLDLGPLLGQEFPDLNFIQNFGSSLAKLNLAGVEILKQLPHQMQFLTALEELEIAELDGLEDLPDWLGDISSLQRLTIKKCTSLMHMPSVGAMRSLSNLQSLEIDDCPELEERCDRETGSEWCKISHIPEIIID